MSSGPGYLVFATQEYWFIMYVGAPDLARSLPAAGQQIGKVGLMRSAARWHISLTSRTNTNAESSIAWITYYCHSR